VSSVSQALITLLRSANSTKSFSSDIIVRTLPQKIIVNHLFLIPSCYLKPCLCTEIHTCLQSRILYSALVYCIADRIEHLGCSVCYILVLSDDRTRAEITLYASALQSLVYADGFKCKAHLMPAGVL
jgi:hypothetical protein